MLKLVHMTCAALSITGFGFRGLLMLCESPLLRARWLRVAPHVVDTVFLATGLALAWRWRQFPFVHSWLTAKVLGLVVYIVLGSIALRRGRTKPVRAAAWIGAIAVFVYIASVARTRSPTLWLI